MVRSSSIVHENCKLRIPAEHVVYTNCCFYFDIQNNFVTQHLTFYADGASFWKRFTCISAFYTNQVQTFPLEIIIIRYAKKKRWSLFMFLSKVTIPRVPNSWRHTLYQQSVSCCTNVTQEQRISVKFGFFKILSTFE